MATMIVTGAGSGLGKALTHRLVADGHRVAMMGRSPEKLSALAESLGDRVLPISVDLSDPQAVHQAFDYAEAWGGAPQWVVHCAGLGHFGALSGQGDDAIQSMLTSNLHSTIWVGREVVRRWGHHEMVLANVLSSAAQAGKAHEAVYCATKWGMRGFLESMRAELKGQPLRLVNLYPSGIRSAFWAGSDHVDSSGFMAPEEAAEYLVDALSAKSSCYVTEMSIGRY
ncbi:SDR family NAD(P)-dependent oxidoreductase [Ferrimonas balearica]|uniref:SDR family NAD(P)-dependent oxidoreductase n=1 Tax=Ferrimonas balearica TaxID=44012 RepID=UPI001C95A2B5|nr:SDR family NAD(P)-dependent oxidoreductase [Ferrimonas balearica]MBY6225293.1 SDR family NAD(P)-dependent oxidoreductase [Ferrimonas balearica]